MTGLSFNIIDGHNIVDVPLLSRFIEEGLFEFASYPIGDRLKVK